MQTTFILELNFGGDELNFNYDINSVADGDGMFTFPDDIKCSYKANAQYKIRAFCMYDKVIAFDEYSGSIRADTTLLAIPAALFAVCATLFAFFATCFTVFATF